jgi:hypothetical protein
MTYQPQTLERSGCFHHYVCSDEWGAENDLVEEESVEWEKGKVIES